MSSARANPYIISSTLDKDGYMSLRPAQREYVVEYTAQTRVPSASAMHISINLPSDTSVETVAAVWTAAVQKLPDLIEHKTFGNGNKAFAAVTA